MIWFACAFLDHGEVDPGERWIESGAPHHVGSIDTSAVFELGWPCRTPVTRGTRSTPAAARSFGLTLIKGSPVDTIFGRALRPMGVLVVSTRWKMIRPTKQEFIDGINVTQDQTYIRALAVDFFISLLNTVAAWAERTISEVQDWDDLMPSEEKNLRGLEKIRQLPVDTPGESLDDITKPPRARCRPVREDAPSCLAPTATPLRSSTSIITSRAR